MRAVCWNNGMNSKTMRRKRPCSLGVKKMAFSLLTDSHERSLGSRKRLAFGSVGVGLSNACSSRGV